MITSHAGPPCSCRIVVRAYVGRIIFCELHRNAHHLEALANEQQDRIITLLNELTWYRGERERLARILDGAEAWKVAREVVRGGTRR